MFAGKSVEENQTRELNGTIDINKQSVSSAPLLYFHLVILSLSLLRSLPKLELQ